MIVAGIWQALVFVPYLLFAGLTLLSVTPEDAPGLWIAMGLATLAFGIAFVLLVVGWKRRMPLLHVVSMLVPVGGVVMFWWTIVNYEH